MVLLRYWPSVGHLALIAICASVGYWRIDTLPAVLPHAEPQSKEPNVPSQDAASDPSAGVSHRLGDAETVATRPLFLPGRQPKTGSGTPPSQELDKDTAQNIAIRMVGYIKRGQRSFAIIETINDGRSHVVQEGDVVDGMSVLKISPNSILIELGGQQESVGLFSGSLP